MSSTLPQMCARLREELDLDEARAKVLVDTACDQIGVDKSGSLVERARACLESLGISVEKVDGTPPEPPVAAADEVTRRV